MLPSRHVHFLSNAEMYWNSFFLAQLAIVAAVLSFIFAANACSNTSRCPA